MDRIFPLFYLIIADRAQKNNPRRKNPAGEGAREAANSELRIQNGGSTSEIRRTNFKSFQTRQRLYRSSPKANFTGVTASTRRSGISLAYSCSSSFARTFVTTLASERSSTFLYFWDVDAQFWLLPATAWK